VKLKQHTYTLEVTGRLWSGPRCNHAYALDKDNLPKTRADVKRIAGDFESIEESKIVHIVTETETWAEETNIAK
jgi:hypothetical protein